MIQPIRVLLADDHRHAREGMREIVSADPDFAVVGEADSGERAIELARELLPELVLMDVHMPGMGGLEAIKAIKSAYPSIKIVVVTVSDDPAHLFEAIRRGAQGYLLKNLNPSSWREYLRAVVLHESPLNPEIALSILREFAGRPERAGASPSAGGEGLPESLTPRELDILRSVARGLTNRDVAAEFGLSEHTVKNHLKNILQKLHLNNRVQLTRFAYEQGWVEPK